MNDECGIAIRPGKRFFQKFLIRHSSLLAYSLLCLVVPVIPSALAQLETIEGSRPSTTSWVNQGQFEGHLALNYSPAGAFSPDSTKLAVVVEDKVVLMDLQGSQHKSLRPHLEGVSELNIHSASFVTLDRLLIMANGIIRPKGKGPPKSTPTLAFLWETSKDDLAGKISAINPAGDYSPPRYFPMIGYLVITKESKFELWNVLTGKGGRLTIPSITRTPNLYALSPDGRWIILAQFEGGGGADPVVVDIRTGKLVDSLRGHHGTTLSIAFSRDNQRVATACEDGKVRIWSVGDWKLLHTLAGHNGTVTWVEFSPDGRWVVSGGYDRTVRIWSVEEGELIQTLTEGKEPIRTVAFSPNGELVAATGENMVWVWRSIRR